MSEHQACRIRVQGVVQGVGFRPRVHALATALGLAGWVRNDGRGVEIEVEGEPAALKELERALREEPPPAARVETVSREAAAATGRTAFAILESRSTGASDLPVSPELATCSDCLAELWDPRDRRYRYPFLNCTNCGPRFTIVKDLPYDRARTTMGVFPPCPDCARDYADPGDRRFHAQPIACPACGPQLRLEVAGRVMASRDEALRDAADRLAEGQILAVKGLGGFHLACDATNGQAVARLRSSKKRDEKPFALMAGAARVVAEFARMSELERRLLEGPQAPIVLLETRADRRLPESIAPGRDRLGFMLPYTPLHHLLLEPGAGRPRVLVMTSGNLSDEPIAHEDADARARLSGIADALLLHDREIHVRTDDSVVAELRGAPAFLRRSRGWAPLPLRLPFAAPPLLAVGPDLKNTFCLARGERAFPSHHLGDLAFHENLEAFESGLEHFERLFRIEPELLACDQHPDYRSTRHARQRAAAAGLPLTAVQHHHAHVVSVMAEHGLEDDERVLGLAFDGSGYGPDGSIWGGEFLVAGYRDFDRLLHLAACPLPGGDAATRRPSRVALAWLRQIGLDWNADLAPVRASSDEERAVLKRQLETGLNCPVTTSMGRLFDAAASLLGLRGQVSYEGQAACELEARASAGETGHLPFEVAGEALSPAPALRALVEGRAAGLSVGVLAARFHRGLALGVTAACCRLRDEGAPGLAVLSGGVWQNRLLTTLTGEALERAGFRVLLPLRLPVNDGGISFGQAAVAAARARSGTLE